MPIYPRDITYSEIYVTKNYEYRHVILPKCYLSILKNRLMMPSEWRDLGIKINSSWENYMIFIPEPHVVLFRRKL